MVWMILVCFLFFFSSRRRHTRCLSDWSSDVCSSDLEAWVGATRAGFVFAVKANMRITHILRLKNAEQATDIFLKAIDPLRTSRRLGPVLFQLPPNMKCDAAVLRDYLALLPNGMRYAFEFRHESWLTEPVYEELRRRNVALCLDRKS